MVKWTSDLLNFIGLLLPKQKRRTPRRFSKKIFLCEAGDQCNAIRASV